MDLSTPATAILDPSGDQVAQRSGSLDCIEVLGTAE